MPDTIADRVLRYLLRFQRLTTPTADCAHRPCETCLATHRPKVQRFIERNRPVEFVILAFPCKSPNPRKVLGKLPDLAEELSLEFLQSFTEHVSHFYPPGARVRICSDGHVFSDLVGVADDEVSRYRAELQQIITRQGGGIETLGLDDLFGAGEYPALRDRLVRTHAVPLADLRALVRTNLSRGSLFNGVHRFLVEDQSVLRPELSRTKIRTLCKGLAYQVIQRSDAWSKRVAEAFPDAVRLSIHPQPCHSAKIGIHLLRTKDNWLTPWHAVALDDGNTISLVKRCDAERLDASLIWRNNRPSHFVAPHIALQEAAA